MYCHKKASQVFRHRHLTPSPSLKVLWRNEARFPRASDDDWGILWKIMPLQLIVLSGTLFLFLFLGSFGSSKKIGQTLQDGIYIYIYTHIYIYIQKYIYIYISSYLSIYLSVYLSVYLSIYLSIYLMAIWTMFFFGHGPWSVPSINSHWWEWMSWDSDLNGRSVGVQATLWFLVTLCKLENGNLQWIYPVKMVIFHSHLSLPEAYGIYHRHVYVRYEVCDTKNDPTAML